MYDSANFRGWGRWSVSRQAKRCTVSESRNSTWMILPTFAVGVVKAYHVRQISQPRNGRSDKLPTFAVGNVKAYYVKPKCVPRESAVCPSEFRRTVSLKRTTRRTARGQFPLAFHLFWDPLWPTFIYYFTNHFKESFTKYRSQNCSIFVHLHILHKFFTNSPNPSSLHHKPP